MTGPVTGAPVQLADRDEVLDVARATADVAPRG
jgi:hypothetical protein